MKTAVIGAFEAKNRFSELLDKAAHGAETIVTKHGHPVAKIVPFKSHDRSTSELLQSLQKTRATIANRGPVRNEGESWNDIGRKGLR